LNSIIERDVSFDHRPHLDLDDDLGCCFTTRRRLDDSSPGAYIRSGGGVEADDIERGIGGGIQRSTIDFDFFLLQSHRTAIRRPLNASAAEAVRSMSSRDAGPVGSFVENYPDPNRD